MKKTFLVFKHEFLNMITGTGYIIITFVVLAIPLLILLGFGIFYYVQGLEETPSEEEVTIGYVDYQGEFKAYTLQDKVTLILYDTQEEATQALVAEDIKEYFIIPADYIATGLIRRYTLEKEIEPPVQVSSAIGRFLISNLIEGKIPSLTADRVQDPMKLITTTLTKTGELASDQGGLGAILLPAFFGLLIGISLMTLSTFLIQGLGEEKENRLIEILLSSVTPRQLLTGKVMGFGAAGILQVVVWLFVPAFLLHRASSTLLSGIVYSLRIPVDFLILAMVYFVLGYLFFSVISAGIAAISPTSRDGQQLAIGFLLPMFIPLWLSSLVMFFPKNPLWTVLTFFPNTAPVMAMVRYGVTKIPAWELAVSIVIMVLSIIGGLALAAKIFRIYLLMYGKRPSIGEMIRALKAG